MLALIQSIMVLSFLTKVPFTSVIISGGFCIFCALYLIGHKCNPMVRYKNTKFNLMFFLVLLLMMVLRICFSSITSSHTSDNDLEYITTMLLAILIVITYFICPNFKSLSIGILLAMAFTAVLAFMELVFHFNTGSSRFSDPSNMFYQSSNSVPTAFYYNENDMLYSIVLFIPLLVVEIKEKVLSVLIFSLILILALVISSKAAIIAIFSYIIWFFLSKSKNKTLYFIAAFFVILFAVASGWEWITSLGIMEKILYRFSGLTSFISGKGGDSSSNERFEIYKSVLEFIWSSGIYLFIGYGSFSIYEHSFLSDFKLRIADFHNMHLEIITLFGLFYYILFIIYFTVIYRTSSNININNRKVFKAMSIIFITIMSIISSSVLKYPSFYIFILLLTIAPMRELYKNAK